MSWTHAVRVTTQTDRSGDGYSMYCFVHDHLFYRNTSGSRGLAWRILSLWWAVLDSCDQYGVNVYGRYIWETGVIPSDVVYLCWPIAPSYLSPNEGGWGGVAGSQPMSTTVHRSPNKLWRSNSIFFTYDMRERGRRGLGSVDPWYSNPIG
jgi:hypothetical protein